MRWSRTFIPTLRDDPSGVVQPGVRRLVRGGFLRRVEPGGYVLLPLLVRVLDNLHRHLVDAFEGAGGCHIELATQPPRVKCDWEAVAGLTDLPEREVMLSFVRRELRSYRQLPLSLLFFPRPGGESLSTSAQVFGNQRIEMLALTGDTDSLLATMVAFEKVIQNALHPCGLTIRPALAENDTRQLVAVSDSPAADRPVLMCPACGYCATNEIAACRPPEESSLEQTQTLAPVSTPGMRTVEEVTAFLGVPAQKLVKTLLYATEQGVIGALIRGDRMLGESKLKRLLGIDKLDLLDADSVRKLTGAAVGFSGPVGLRSVRLIADFEVPLLRNFVVGGNTDDVHLINVNPGDLVVEFVADLRCAVEGDPCPDCGSGRLQAQTGIAVGKIASVCRSPVSGIRFDDEDGGEREVISGTLHLDLAAILLAVAENHHDDRGPIWPVALAPFTVHLMAVGAEDEAQRAACEKLEREFSSVGIEVLYDDRPLRPGVRFHDADLTGIPLRVIIGPKRLAEGQVEISLRATGQKDVIPLNEAVADARLRLLTLKMGL